LHDVGVLLASRRFAAARRALQGGDHVRVEHVVLAAVHVLEQAADIHVAARSRPRAQLARVGIQPREARRRCAAVSGKHSSTTSGSRPTISNSCAAR
jgi:hypothetical protein